jgi:type II secretory pathway component PulK
MKMRLTSAIHGFKHATPIAPTTQPPPISLSTLNSQLSTSANGSVLIIVLWVAFGLVSLALYFAYSMMFELRAADNRVASLEAEQAIAGAARYVSNILATTETPGFMPDLQSYESEAVPVGDATFWLIGRGDDQSQVDQVYFGLVDEASKLNLNTATTNMLEWLPGMTPELAAAIIDWRDSDSDVSDGGAEDETYQRLTPAYRCKNAPFESVEELRLVYGMDLEILYGEDANLNGVVDYNENDGEVSFPNDNRDGRLDPGLLEYVTVYSKEPNTRTNGEPRVVLNGTNETQLTTLFTEKLGADRATAILRQAGIIVNNNTGGRAGGNTPRPGGSTPGGGGTGAGAGSTATFNSVLEFYTRSGMTADEFAQIEGDITASSAKSLPGLVNVNTASEAVLACIPGIGTEFASTLVGQRQRSADLRSLAWIVEVLGSTNAVQAGRYLTVHTYQFTADIAALGHYDRGYQRVKYIFDASDGTPRIVYRQDLTHLGWALGEEVRDALETSNALGTRNALQLSTQKR